MTLTIIGIHGLSNKPEKEILAQWWKQSIDEGLEKNERLSGPSYEFEIVYWADRLYKNPLHRIEAFQFDSHYNREPYVPAEEGALKPYKEGVLDEARRFTFNKLGDLLDKAREITGAQALSSLVLERVLKDLAYYYDPERLLQDDRQRMRPARQVLMDAVETVIARHRGKQLMIIGHSMGSIIGYDVLRNIGRVDQSLMVDHFVTIGSPLGLPLVKAKVYDERQHYAGDEAIRTPTIVGQTWVNFADRKDPVAFDTHLSDDYHANASGIEVRDDLVFNDYRMDGEDNHHKSYGYLRTPELSKHIAACL